MIRVISLISVILLYGCSSNKVITNSLDGNLLPPQSSQSYMESSVVDGGTSALSGKSTTWLPAVFTDFDEATLNLLADDLNQGKVKRATIIYPSKMRELALKIQSYLQGKTNQTIPMLNIELRDTKQIQYDLSQVIVTLYY